MPDNIQLKFAGIPLNLEESENGQNIFSIDLKNPVAAGIIAIERDNTNHLVFQFQVPGVKVPPEGRPPGATHLCSLPYNETDQNKGILIPEGIEAKIAFSADGDDPIKKVAKFIFKIKLADIKISSE